MENLVRALSVFRGKRVLLTGDTGFKGSWLSLWLAEAGLLHLNCDKAHHSLGWKPRWGFERTVKETVDWYRDVAFGKAVAAVSASQIQAYMENSYD